MATTRRPQAPEPDRPTDARARPVPRRRRRSPDLGLAPGPLPVVDAPDSGRLARRFRPALVRLEGRTLLAATVTITASVPSAVFGQPVTFTLSESGGTPGGSFEVDEPNDYVLGSVSTTGNSASLTLSNLPVGNFAITAFYASPGGAVEGTGALAAGLPVTPDPTSTSLVASPNVVGLNAPFTLAATVTANAPGAGRPTGTVTFFEGQTNLGTAPVDASGAASISARLGIAGPHSIQAMFQGDAGFGPSSSGIVVESVAAEGTTTTLATSGSPAVFTTSATLTATVAPVAPGAGVPVGVVQFLDGSTPIGSASVDALGQASVAPSLPVGPHYIRATFVPGDANDLGSSSATLLQIAVAPGLQVSASTSSPVFGQPVTFTANQAGGPLSGTVVFYELGPTAASPLATVPIVNGSVATFDATALGLGPHLIGASFELSGAIAPLTFNVSGVVTVAPSPSSVLLASSANPSTAGQPVTFTAQVRTPFGAVPTGQVLFEDAAGPIVTASLVNGFATLAVASFPGPSTSITARYLGDGNVLPSLGTLAQVVNLVPTHSLLVTPLEPVPFGSPLFLGVQVVPDAPGPGRPRGQVVFLVDGQSFPASLDVGGLASITFGSGLAVGTHSVSVGYAGDSNFAASQSLTGGVTVIPASTTAQVFTSLSPTVFGQPTTYRVVVTPSGLGTPTGSVQFLADGRPIGTATLGPGGVATLSNAGLAVGSHSITATYSGDGNFVGGPSTNAVAQVVLQSASRTTVSKTGSGIFGQSTTFLTQVQAMAPGAGVPSGFVTLNYTFLGVSGSFGTRMLDGSGRFSLDVPLLFLGSLQVTAFYGGDGDFGPSNSAFLLVPVGPAPTTTTITSGPDPSVFGQPTTLTASVAAITPGSGSPTGGVQFFADESAIGVPQPLANGRATLTVPNLAVGTRIITAHYLGDGNFLPNDASAYPQVVSRAASRLALVPASSPSPVFGQSVTFTAVDSAVAPGSGVPTGIVAFFDEAGLIGTARLVAGVASITVPRGLPVGLHSVYAMGPGDANFLASPNTLPIALTVAPAPTIAALRPSTVATTYGASVRLDADVIATPPTFVPAGTVTFFDGQVILGTAKLDALGHATLTTAPTRLGAGRATITVAYAPADGNDLPSTSAPATIAVAPAPLLVTASPESVVYGSPVPAPTGSVVGLMAGDAITATFSTAANASSDVTPGGYPITVALGDPGGRLANYAQAIVGAAVTILRADQSIAWATPRPIVYGTALGPAQLNASATGPGVAPAGLLTYSPALGTVLDAGSGRTLTVRVAGTRDYNPATASVLLDVTPAPLVITAAPESVVYGSPVPAPTGSVVGLVAGDAITATFSTAANSTSDVTPGGYRITGTPNDPGKRLGNYALTVVDRTVTILQASQSITWTVPGPIVYGTALGPAQLDARVAVPGGAPAGLLTYSPAPGVVLDAGPGQVLTVSVAGTTDYKPATASVRIDVNAAPLEVTVDSLSKVFGAVVPALTGTVAGLVNGDRISATFSTTASASSDVVAGGYPIDAGLVDPGGRLPNYSVTIRPGVLTIVGAGTTLTLGEGPTTKNPGQPPGTSSLGQSYTFSAVVSAVDASSRVPTGSVAFFEGTTLLSTVPLVGGTASFVTTTLPVGVHLVVARYLPDPDFAVPVVAGGGVVVTVAPAQTVAVVAASATSTTVGQAVFFSATVRVVAPGTGVPTGLVQFLADSEALGPPVPLINGQALTSTSKLSVGLHTITAFYLGSPGQFAASPLATGTVSILAPFAGTGNAGFGGDNGPALQATFNQPSGLAADLSGNLYIADSANNRIRRIAPNGIVTTVAGVGVAGNSGDGGLAINAQLNSPGAIAVDARGDLFIADTGNNSIREITQAGMILTLVGSTAGGVAALQQPLGIAVDAAGLQLYIANTGANQVLRVTGFGPVAAQAGTGLLRVDAVAGVGSPAALVTDQPALNQPSGLALDSRGDLYIADTGNNLVRRVNTQNGMIATVVGSATATLNNDGGPATEAALHGPRDVAVDGSFNLYIADTGGDQVRVVSPTGTISSIISGSSPGDSFQSPSGIATGPGGAVFISNTSGNNILSISGSLLGFDASGSGGGGGGSTGVQVFVGAVSSALSSSNAVQLTAQLLPLTSSSLELLATLTATSIELSVEANAETASSAGLPNQPPSSAGQASAPGQDATTEETEDPVPGLGSFLRFLFGLDEPSGAATPAPEPAGPTSSGEGLGLGDFLPAPADRETFDRAIRSLSLEGPARAAGRPFDGIAPADFADLANPGGPAWPMVVTLGLLGPGLRAASHAPEPGPDLRPDDRRDRRPRRS